MSSSAETYEMHMVPHCFGPLAKEVVTRSRPNQKQARRSVCCIWHAVKSVPVISPTTSRRARDLP